MLPQHARHCPVLEAGSALGFMVYPSLADTEMVQVSYEGEGKYQLIYSVKSNGREWAEVFTVTYQMPLGGIGASSEEIALRIPDTPDSRAAARLMARMFIAVDDLGTPPGAVTLRGAYNFQTPPGWDTVYTPIFNMIERPIAPMLVIRVETDWHVHDSEFRYVLQPGETLTMQHAMPIGQVMFVPREEVTFRDGTEEEIQQRLEIADKFYKDKMGSKVKTSYGLEYSPHYLRTSRQKAKGETEAPGEERSE